MNKDRKLRGRALALALTLTTLGGGGLAVALADSAGAATSAGPRALAPGTHASAPAARVGPSSSVGPANTAARPTPSTPSTSSTSSTPRTSAGSVATTPARAAPSSSVTAQPQTAATRLPAAETEKWSAVGTPSVRGVDGHDIGENECAEIVGASTWTQQGYSGGDGQNVAIQDTFGFTSSAAAEAAYQNAVTGMDACQQTTRALQAANKVTADARVTKTAGLVRAAAWERSWTGVMGMSADGPQTNHIYLAVNGTRLIVLQFTEFPGQTAAYDTAADPQILAMLDTELAG